MKRVSFGRRAAALSVAALVPSPGAHAGAGLGVFHVPLQRSRLLGARRGSLHLRRIPGRGRLEPARPVLREPRATRGFEEQVRNTITVMISYGWHERLTLVAQVPYSINELTEAEEVQKANGLSDPLFFVYGRTGASKFEQGLGRLGWLWAAFSVKTPWGQNDASVDGERLDEHVQPGTGRHESRGRALGSLPDRREVFDLRLRDVHGHGAEPVRLQVRR